MKGDDWNWGRKAPGKVKDKTASTRAASDSTKIPIVAEPEDVHESTQSLTRDLPMAGAQMMGDLPRFNGNQNPKPGLDPVKMKVDPHIQDNNRLPQYKPSVNSVSAGATKLNSLMNPQIIWDSVRDIDIAGGSLHNYSTLCGGQERVGDNFTVNTDYKMEVARGNNGNAEGKFPPKSCVPATSGLHRYNFQVDSGYATFPKYGNVFSRSDGNDGAAHSSNVSSNLRRNSSIKSADKECHQSLPQDGIDRNVEVLDSGPRGVTGQRVVPSFTHNANQPSYEKPPETMGTASPIVPENSSFNDLAANTVVKDKLVAGQQSTVHQVAGAPGLFPKTARPEPAGTSGQSFAAIHVQPFKDLPGPDSSAGKHITAADGCFPAEASDVSPFPSLKKDAMQPSPSKRQTSTQPSTNPNSANATSSFTSRPQTSPSHPLVHQDPPSLPPIPHIATLVRPQTQLAQRQTPTRQMALRAVHAQSIRVNTNKPSSGPYIENKIRASPAITPLLQSLSVPGRPLPMHLAQAPQRSYQTNPTQPLLLGAAAFQLLANQVQAYPPPVGPSSSLPPRSNYVLPAAHVNFRGLDPAPLPMGTKCLLCKCDLRSLPKVPTLQPDTPPAVAVLPCHHTFHDQCLRDITPKDQAQNRRCVLCATGES